MDQDTVVARDPVGAAETVPGANVRTALGLTPHQLGDLTAQLAIDVGDRPNYPRYRREDVHRLTAVGALRELRAPLEIAARAGGDYGPQVLAGRGWLLAAPTEDAWTVSFVSTGPDLVQWLRAAGGRGLVLDLDRVAARAEADWRRARDMS